VPDPDSSATSARSRTSPKSAELVRGDAQAWSLADRVAPGFVMLLNDDDVCVYATSGCVDVLGRSGSSLVGQRPEAWLTSPLTDPSTLPSGPQEIGEGTFRTTVQALHPDGDVRWLQLTSSSSGLDRGDLVRTVVHVQDISGDVSLERGLNRAVLRYLSVLELIDEGVLQLDARLRVSGFNGQLTTLSGHRPEEILGRPAFDVFDLRDMGDRPIRAQGHALPDLLAGPDMDGDEGPWLTLARTDGSRVLVQVRVASYETVRTSDDAHLMVFTRLVSLPSGADWSRRRARAAVGLTTREGDVLDGLAAGRSVSEIAEYLGISIYSVRTHLKGLTAKLGVRSQLQALVAAVQDGLVQIEPAKD
jgi:DNA-binding CsgD family transcriptional regulator